MPLYIAQSGDLEGCHRCLTIHDWTIAIWTTYDVWTIAVWTILDYKDIQTTRTFGLSRYGLSPFGLFWTTGTFGLQGHLDYRRLDF